MRYWKTVILGRILIGLLMLAGGLTQAENLLRYNSIPFKTLSIEQGLPQMTVTAIHQDRAGFMWFGSQDGLSRFDGYRFRIFRHLKNDPTSLSRDFIGAITEDEQGHLWIGTRGGGLNEFDPLKEQFKTHLLKEGAVGRRSASDVRSLLISGNRLYAGTLDGLYYLNRQDGQAKQVLIPDLEGQAYTVYDLLSLRDGQLLISSDEGLFLLDENTLAVENLNDRILGGADFTFKATAAIYRDSRERFWIATASDGVLLLDKDLHPIKHFRHDQYDQQSLAYWTATDFQEDPWGNTWIASQGGLNVYLEKEDRMIRLADSSKRPLGIGDHSFLSLYLDRTDVLWVGSSVGGVSRFSPHYTRFGRIVPADSIGAMDKRILGLVSTPDGELVAGSSNGLMIRRKDADPFQLVTSPELGATGKSIVYGVTRGKDGTIWVGSNAGLQRLPEGAETLQPPEHTAPYYFVSIHEDHKGLLWLGHPLALQAYDPVTREVVASADIKQPYAIIALDQQTLVAGGLRGLYLVDSDTAEIIDQLDGGIHNFTTVSYLVRSHDGALWMGTQGSGIYRIELASKHSLKNATISSFTMESGLASNAIGGIVEDADGHIWFSTTRGITRINPATGQTENFGRKDGAFAEGYFIGSAMQDDNGLIYFGGPNGITVFSPDWIRQDPHAPQVMLTELRLNNHTAGLSNLQQGSPLEYPIQYLEEISIDPMWSSISVEFSTQHYAYPDINVYAYMLEGFDQDWIQTGADRRFASYSNLDPGQYIFKVKAANSDGIWSDEVRSLTINILPHWYQTYWAYVLYAVAFVGLAYAYSRLRIANILKHNRQLEDYATKRTVQLVEANDQLEIANRELDKLARTDSLTELMNRRAFIEHFQEEVVRRDRSNIPFSIALLDIDHFKLFNDRHGHDCGDHVLREIAVLLRENTRGQDVVCRWGGEEFTILFPETPLAGAANIMEKLRRQIELSRFNWLGDELSVTITAGVGEDRGSTEIGQCMKPVDRALLAGKQEGRNRVVQAG